jgi:hypothetical protein
LQPRRLARLEVHLDDVGKRRDVQHFGAPVQFQHRPGRHCVLRVARIRQPPRIEVSIK